MDRLYLEGIQAFVEGRKDLREWPAWWRENATAIEQNEGRTIFLKIKQSWREGAISILDRHSITYQADISLNWDRCDICGEPLFHVFPGETTKEQIVDFAEASHLPHKDQIIADRWIHPGTFCPNGCTTILVEYRRQS